MCIFLVDSRAVLLYKLFCSPRGSNSVVECNLAKVEVAGSNPVSRSRYMGPCLCMGFYFFCKGNTLPFLSCLPIRHTAAVSLPFFLSNIRKRPPLLREAGVLCMQDVQAYLSLSHSARKLASCSFTSLKITGLSIRMATRLGIAMSALQVSASSHTRSSWVRIPVGIARQ